MNRHQSNPFLSGWDDDDDEIKMAPPAGGHSIFDTPPLAGDGVEPQQDQQLAGVDAGGSTMAAANPRRSSCGQADSGGQSVAGQSARQGLYRRNMSSFEAASSLQYEQEQHLQQNGRTSDEVLQKELIARMTADFQSAIQTSDKQFVDDLASFNPFDPFETIVDDDSVHTDHEHPQPAAAAAATTTTTDTTSPERPDNMGLNDGGRPGSRLHESIDEDEEELVSTPVRNIKSSPSPNKDNQNNNNNNNSGHCTDDHYDTTSNQNAAEQMTTETGDQQTDKNSPSAPSTAQAGGQDSMAKATLFASLLASAENAAGAGADAADIAGLSPNESLGLDDQAAAAAATSHVIKGSPTTLDGSSERPVSFFDPFETVIDKDALTSLVSEQQQPGAVKKSDTSGGGSGGDDEPAKGLLRTGGRVAESASIETVIENQPSPKGEQDHDQTNPTGAANDAGEGADRLTNAADAPNEPSASKSQQRLANYDASTALARPGQRQAPRLNSGITPPQPTPAKRPLKSGPKTSRVQRRGDAEWDSSSSSSSDEDDRIKVVIKARDATLANKQGADAAGGQGPVLVPLLPPPPSKSSMKQARERGQVEDMPSPIMGYKSRQRVAADDESESGSETGGKENAQPREGGQMYTTKSEQLAKRAASDADEDHDQDDHEEEDDDEQEDGQFVIPMTLSDNEDDNEYGKPETPLYDEDTSYVLEDYPTKYDGPGWEMMLRYPPKKKLTANRFWKKIFVKLAQVPQAPDTTTAAKKHAGGGGGDQAASEPSLCWALQIFDNPSDKKPMQEIPIQATYTVSEICSQLFDQFGKIFTIKLQYIFYKERVGVRQGQLARFIHTGHIGSSTTSGGHGVDPISIGAIKRMGAPIEHSPQISQIIKLGCSNYDDIKSFRETLEDCLFRMPIHRDRALTTYKTEEVQMAVRDETYIEINQVGQVTRQLARVRLFFLSFLNGAAPLVEVGVNEFHRQGREVVGRMDILPVITEEWIRLEAWELHSTVDKAEFENVESRLIKLTPPDATFFELMRFRVRPPRNRELPLQISANMTVTRTRVTFNCDVMVPGCVSRKHGQIPCENIAIRLHIPECWIYFFREEKHFRMGSKKSVNRRPGKVKGIERFLGGGVSGTSGLQDFSDESSLIEVTSGQAKYEHHHQGVVWRAARWPKESQSAYVQNSMKIRLPLTAYDKMPDTFYEYLHVEYTMPATTVSHTTLRSIAVNPCDDEPPEKYVRYAAKYDYKVKMRLAVNLGNRRPSQDVQPEASPIVIMKRPAVAAPESADDELEREKDEDEDDDDDDDDDEDVDANGQGLR